MFEGDDEQLEVGDRRINRWLVADAMVSHIDTKGMRSHALTHYTPARFDRGWS